MKEKRPMWGEAQNERQLQGGRAGLNELCRPLPGTVQKREGFLDEDRGPLTVSIVEKKKGTGATLLPMTTMQCPGGKHGDLKKQKRNFVGDRETYVRKKQ